MSNQVPKLEKTKDCLGFKEIQEGQWNEAQKNHILNCPRCQAVVRTMVIVDESSTPADDLENDRRHG